MVTYRKHIFIQHNTNLPQLKLPYSAFSLDRFFHLVGHLVDYYSQNQIISCLIVIKGMGPAQLIILQILYSYLTQPWLQKVKCIHVMFIQFCNVLVTLVVFMERCSPFLVSFCCYFLTNHLVITYCDQMEWNAKLSLQHLLWENFKPQCNLIQLSRHQTRSF